MIRYWWCQRFDQRWFCTQKFDLGQKILWYNNKVICKKKCSRGMFYKITQKIIRTKKDTKNQDKKSDNESLRLELNLKYIHLMITLYLWLEKSCFHCIMHHIMNKIPVNFVLLLAIEMQASLLRSNSSFQLYKSTFYDWFWGKIYKYEFCKRLSW